MDSKDKRLILAFILAFLLWGVVDFLFSPKPLVFLLGGEEASVYKAEKDLSSRVNLIPELEEDVDLSVFVPEVEVKRIVRTVYEKPYEKFFLEDSDKESLLNLVRHEPVIELSGVEEPSLLQREGGTINISVRAKAYYRPVYGLNISFVCPQGWEYIPGTTSNRFSGNGEIMERRLASLEDEFQSEDSGEVLAQYLQDSNVEPSAELVGDPPSVMLTWSYDKKIDTDQAIYLEFPLQTTGTHLPGPQEFLVRATAFDRPVTAELMKKSMMADAGGDAIDDAGADPNAPMSLFAELVLRVNVAAEEEALQLDEVLERNLQDWESLLLTSGIDRGYREPMSGVGF